MIDIKCENCIYNNKGVCAKSHPHKSVVFARRSNHLCGPTASNFRFKKLVVGEWVEINSGMHDYRYLVIEIKHIGEHFQTVILKNSYGYRIAKFFSRSLLIKKRLGIGRKRWFLHKLFPSIFLPYKLPRGV